MAASVPAPPGPAATTVRLLPAATQLARIVPFLAAHTGAECVLARNDTAVRKLEALPQEVRLLHGKRITEVTIEEHGIRHLVRPFTGHKTGFYLDQAPARLLVKQLSK